MDCVPVLFVILSKETKLFWKECRGWHKHTRISKIAGYSFSVLIWRHRFLSTNEFISLRHTQEIIAFLVMQYFLSLKVFPLCFIPSFSFSRSFHFTFPSFFPFVCVSLSSSYSTAALEFEREHQIAAVYESPKMSRRSLRLQTGAGHYVGESTDDFSQNHSSSYSSTRRETRWDCLHVLTLTVTHPSSPERWFVLCVFGSIAPSL